MARPILVMTGGAALEACGGSEQPTTTIDSGAPAIFYGAAMVDSGATDAGMLRQLVKVHTSIVRDTVRVQNRIKALYRSRGVNATGSSV